MSVKPCSRQPFNRPINRIKLQSVREKVRDKWINFRKGKEGTRALENVLDCG